MLAALRERSTDDLLERWGDLLREAREKLAGGELEEADNLWTDGMCAAVVLMTGILRRCAPRRAPRNAERGKPCGERRLHSRQRGRPQPHTGAGAAGAPPQAREVACGTHDPNLSCMACARRPRPPASTTAAAERPGGGGLARECYGFRPLPLRFRGRCRWKAAICARARSTM